MIDKTIEKYYLSFQTGCYCDGYIYTVDNLTGIIMRISVEDLLRKEFKNEIISYIGWDKGIKTNLIEGIFKKDNSLFIVKKCFSGILRYDINSNMFIPCMDNDKVTQFTCGKTICIKDKIYVLPQFADNIFYIYDMKNESGEKILLSKDLPSLKNERFYGWIQTKETINIWIRNTRDIVTFNTNTYEIGIRKAKADLKNLYSVNDELWVETNRHIGVLNEDGSLRNEIELRGLENCNKISRISHVFIKQSKLICVGASEKKVIVIDLNTMDQEIISYNCETQNEGRILFRCGLNVNGINILIPKMANCIMIIDRNGDITKIDSFINGNDISERVFNDREYIKENSGVFSLMSYIDYIKKGI